MHQYYKTTKKFIIGKYYQGVLVTRGEAGVSEQTRGKAILRIYMEDKPNLREELVRGGKWNLYGSEMSEGKPIQG